MIIVREIAVPLVCGPIRSVSEVAVVLPRTALIVVREVAVVLECLPIVAVREGAVLLTGDLSI
jgi:hypothetical protein